MLLICKCLKKIIFMLRRLNFRIKTKHNSVNFHKEEMIKQGSISQIKKRNIVCRQSDNCKHHSYWAASINYCKMSKKYTKQVLNN